MQDDQRRISKIFGKVKRIDASYEVRASAKIYKEIIKVFIPNNPYKKLIPFMEERKEEKYLQDVEDWKIRTSKDPLTTLENIERSLRKTKTLVSDLVLCNDFQLFATFTFSPDKTRDRFNPEIIKTQMSNWLKNQRSRNGKFAYLIIPEYHQDRKALHFHGLFANYPGKLVPAYKTIKGRRVYHFKSYTLGFNSAVNIDNPQKVSSYIRKYITKDMPQFKNKHRFWASKGLERPRLVDNPDNLSELGEPLSIYENEYGKILYYQRFSNSDEEVKAT